MLKKETKIKYTRGSSTSEVITYYGALGATFLALYYMLTPQITAQAEQRQTDHDFIIEMKANIDQIPEMKKSVDTLHDDYNQLKGRVDSIKDDTGPSKKMVQYYIGPSFGVTTKTAEIIESNNKKDNPPLSTSSSLIASTTNQ